MNDLVNNSQSKVNTSKKEKSVLAKKTKQPIEKSSTQINEVLRPSAENRIKKMQNFQLMAEKHEFLQNKKDELEKFIISSDGTKEKITLSNAKGFILEISNSQVVEEMTNVVSKKLQLFLDASEKDILNYTI